MINLNELCDKFNKIGFKAEIDDTGDLCVTSGKWSDIDILCELDDLPAGEVDWRKYDCIGIDGSLIVVKNRKFLKCEV